MKGMFRRDKRISIDEFSRIHHLDKRGLLDPRIDCKVHKSVLWVTKPIESGAAHAVLILEVFG